MKINLVPIQLLSPIIIYIIFNSSSIAVSDTTTETSTTFNTTSQWLHFSTNLNQPTIKFSMSLIIAAILSFFAASISSAGGIGGGGLFISIMTIVAGLEMKTASSFSAFMVTGVSVANVGINLFIRNAGGKTLIDFDLALVLQPCLLLGVSIGVICNRVFPNWLVTSLFAVFLAWSTMKTCEKGVFYWRSESERGSRRGDEGARSPLLVGEEGGERREVRFPWKKLGLLVIIWLLFFFINLFRGNKYGQV